MTNRKIILRGFSMDTQNEHKKVADFSNKKNHEGRDYCSKIYIKKQVYVWKNVNFFPV